MVPNFTDGFSLHLLACIDRGLDMRHRAKQISETNSPLLDFEALENAIGLSDQNTLNILN